MLNLPVSVLSSGSNTASGIPALSSAIIIMFGLWSPDNVACWSAILAFRWHIAILANLGCIFSDGTVSSNTILSPVTLIRSLNKNAYSPFGNLACNHWLTPAHITVFNWSCFVEVQTNRASSMFNKNHIMIQLNKALLPTPLPAVMEIPIFVLRSFISSE